MGRLTYNEREQHLMKAAEKLDKKAKEFRAKAHKLRDERERTRPLIDRLVFAATARCDCGAGMAYDPIGDVCNEELKKGGFPPPNAWECSDVLAYYAGILSNEAKCSVLDREHTSPLSFAFYEIKSENQPSAHGQTTRPGLGDR